MGQNEKDEETSRAALEETHTESNRTWYRRYWRAYRMVVTGAKTKVIASAELDPAKLFQVIQQLLIPRYKKCQNDSNLAVSGKTLLGSFVKKGYKFSPI